jgi:molecular chaperone Hsp33
VIRDYGFGEPYAGHSKIISGEIAEDITNYYAVSEQTPTVCALGVRVARDGSIKSAGGFILQLLPGAADGGLAARLESSVGALGSLSALISRRQNGRDIAERFSALFPFRLSMNPRWNTSAPAAEKNTAGP